MKDTIFVTERSALEKLVHEASHSNRIKCTPIAMLVHVLFQILVAIFEDKDELGFGMYNVMEPYDIDMLEFLH